MAAWSINEEVEIAIGYGFTVEQISKETGVTILQNSETDKWQVLGRRDLQTFTKWYNLNCCTTFTKHGGEWVIKGRGLVEDEWATVAKRDGTTVEKLIREIISDKDGVQIARIY